MPEKLPVRYCFLKFSILETPLKSEIRDMADPFSSVLLMIPTSETRSRFCLLYTSHAAIPEEERNARGITNRLLRLSVGLENACDLIADLAQAMDVDTPSTCPCASCFSPYNFDRCV